MDEPIYLASSVEPPKKTTHALIIEIWVVA